MQRQRQDRVLGESGLLTAWARGTVANIGTVTDKLLSSRSCSPTATFAIALWGVSRVAMRGTIGPINSPLRVNVFGTTNLSFTTAALITTNTQKCVQHSRISHEVASEMNAISARFGTCTHRNPLGGTSSWVLQPDNSCSALMLFGVGPY